MKKNSTNRSSSKNGLQNRKKNSELNDEKSLLRQYFIDELKDIYWAEKHLLKSLPKLEKAATSDELKQAFSDHLSETEEQVTRLEDVFGLLEEKAQSKKCEAIEGLTREADVIIEETEEGTLTRDVALIVAAQKVEHYEIATYGGLVQIARTLEEEDAAELLEQTLEEEKKSDKQLTDLAEEHINESALAETKDELENAEE